LQLTCPVLSAQSQAGLNIDFTRNHYVKTWLGAPLEKGHASMDFFCFETLAVSHNITTFFKQRSFWQSYRQQLHSYLQHSFIQLGLAATRHHYMFL
jgi:hypothetical protein